MSSSTETAPEITAATRWTPLIWPLRIIGAIVFFAALLGAQSLIKATVDPYNQQIIALAGVNVILAVSLNLINGVTGQFSLGHAGFMAVGAYSCAAFTFYAGPRLALVDPLIFAIGLLIGALCAGLAGLLVGLPSLRLRGDYLAIVTLGFGQIVVSIIRTVKEVGDASGFTGLPRYTTLAWVFGLVFLCILSMRNLADSQLGRSMRAVRDDEIAAEAAGIDTTRVKVLAFVISAMWAGVAGGLYVHYVQLAHPNDFLFLKSIEIVVMVVLGGLGSITGAASTAVMLRFLEERLRDPDWAFGAGLALVLLATLLSYPRYRAQMPAFAGWFGWLRWPVVSLIGLILIFLYGREWLANNVSSLRYIIYALILIVLMLLRPQGLFGSNELSWAGIKNFLRRGQKPT